MHLHCSSNFMKISTSVQLSSVAQLCVTLRSHVWSTPGFPVHHQLPEVLQTSCLLSQWCHPTISSSVVPFSSHLQTFPEPVFFNESVLRINNQTIGVSASASVFSMNIQDWFTLEWTDWISLQSKGLWRVFSNTTVQKQQFFGAQPAL